MGCRRRAGRAVAAAGHAALRVRIGTPPDVSERRRVVEIEGRRRRHGDRDGAGGGPARERVVTAPVIVLVVGPVVVWLAVVGPAVVRQGPQTDGRSWCGQGLDDRLAPRGVGDAGAGADDEPAGCRLPDLPAGEVLGPVVVGAVRAEFQDDVGPPRAWSRVRSSSASWAGRRQQGDTQCRSRTRIQRSSSAPGRRRAHSSRSAPSSGGRARADTPPSTVSRRWSSTSRGAQSP